MVLVSAAPEESEKIAILKCALFSDLKCPNTFLRK
jgi:hypothetical protein